MQFVLKYFCGSKGSIKYAHESSPSHEYIYVLCRSWASTGSRKKGLNYSGAIEADGM